MTTLTIKRNGNPKMREEGWKGNKYLYVRGKLVISFWKGGRVRQVRLIQNPTPF